jgi:hypothetical protein
MVGSKAIDFIHFHGVFLRSQHEMWSKQHNRKVRLFVLTRWQFCFKKVSKGNSAAGTEEKMNGLEALSHAIGDEV